MERQLSELATNVKVLTTKFDGMTDLMDERWKSMEQRLEMNARQEQQAIKLLTEALEKLEERQRTSSSELADIRQKHGELKTEFNDWRRVFENSQTNVKTWITVLGGGFVTTVGTIIAFIVTKHP